MIQILEPDVKEDANANLDIIGNFDVFFIKFFLNWQKSLSDDKGKCVSRQSCLNYHCKPNETFTQCGNSCLELTCIDLFIALDYQKAPNDQSGLDCPLQCEERCECNEGLFRYSNGSCVVAEHCLICPFNEEYTGIF